MKRGRDPKARTPRISPIACRRKAEGKPFPQFIIHIYLYLSRFPYNVWLFVAKNLSLLSSLNKKEQINTRRKVAERVADGLSAGCGFSFDFSYQSCSTLIGILSSRTSKRKRLFAVSHRNCSWRRVNHLRVPSDDSRYRVSFLRSSRESFPLSLILLDRDFYRSSGNAGKIHSKGGAV